MQLALSPQMAPHTSGNKLPVKRTVPMQVLALGFPRTGTASLKIALETLGYVCTNHGFSAFSRTEEINMWIQAIKAKFFGEGTPYGREEWDRLLGDCQAISDMPHILFAEELIAPRGEGCADESKPGELMEVVSCNRIGKPETYPPAKVECLARSSISGGSNTSRKQVFSRITKRVNDTAQFHETVSAGRRSALWKLAPKLAETLLATVFAVITAFNDTKTHVGNPSAPWVRPKLILESAYLGILDERLENQSSADRKGDALSGCTT
ncbi:hypothetical protein B0H11DRAFT_1920028 [Mycena galericulata]|nr:hypothetical protein B0H11DRAFT_1920028 [Mycena galericulata]